MKYYILRRHKYSMLIPQCVSNATRSESKTPRICAAPTLEGCLFALGTGIDTWHVHMTEETPDVLHPSRVWDADYTGEVWYLRPIVPVYLGAFRAEANQSRPCGCGSGQPVGVCSSPYGWENCG